MIADINITEKSFDDKLLMSGVKFSINEAEKVGVIGRNGVGKSTLFSILSGEDVDYTGDITFRRGVSVVATKQEHFVDDTMTTLQYVLHGLPEYARLSKIIETYPELMGDDMRKIDEYTEALERFEQKGFYHIEDVVSRELELFQLQGVAHRPFMTLSGGQKRLVEVVKIMHSDAHVALIDEPTNHMDYVAKAQFIEWMKSAREAMLVITHDRDVLKEVDRIVEIRDGVAYSYKGNYDAYLKQNAVKTSTAMTDFEQIERRKTNLREKVLQFRRLKERSRDPDTIKQFKRREMQAAAELAELEKIVKPSFWIDQDSAENLDFKHANRYEKYKARNIRMDMRTDDSRSSKVIAHAKQVALGFGDTILFEGASFELREKEAIELRGRNGAGKSTLIKALLGMAGQAKSTATQFDGELYLDPSIPIGVYEQEVSPKYFPLSLMNAIEQIYLDKKLSITTTKVRQLLHNYLFTNADFETPVERLSGGQKARLQIIAMLSNNPQLLILDEPTNHLDLPSIEELENALKKYTGAVLYVSHDGYFRDAMGGDVVKIGAQ